MTHPFVSQVSSFRKKSKDCLVCSKNEQRIKRFKVGSLIISLNLFKTLVVLGQNGLFDLLRIADQSSIYPTLPCQIYQGKGSTHPT